MRGLALVAVMAVATVVAGPTTQAASDPWKPLYRPLQIPRIAPGDACPASTVDPSVDFLGFGVGPGLGPGPAYPVGLHVADATLELAPPRNFESRAWGGQKVLWFVHPDYQGPVLIRGRQLDGPYRVRFERGDVPPRELRILPSRWRGHTNGMRDRPSFTRLRATGCYGYQIDGRTFSRVIVFRAQWW